MQRGPSPRDLVEQPLLKSKPIAAGQTGLHRKHGHLGRLAYRKVGSLCLGGRFVGVSPVPVRYGKGGQLPLQIGTLAFYLPEGYLQSKNRKTHHETAYESHRRPPRSISRSLLGVELLGDLLGSLRHVAESRCISVTYSIDLRFCGLRTLDRFAEPLLYAISHDGTALVVEDAAGEAHQDRGQGGVGCAVRGVPDGRGRYPSLAVPGDPRGDSTAKVPIGSVQMTRVVADITRNARGRGRWSVSDRKHGPAWTPRTRASTMSGGLRKDLGRWEFACREAKIR